MIRTSSQRLVPQGYSILRKTFNGIKSSKSPLASANVLNISKNNSSTSSSSGDINVTSPQTTTNDSVSTYSPSEGYIRLSPFDPITIPDITLDRYIWQNYLKWENKVATICIHTNRQYTFAQLRDFSASFAVRLQKKFKLKARDVIGLCLPNLPEYPICVFGGLEAGLTITTVNPAYTSDEIGRQLINSNAKFVIGTVSGYETLKKACKLIQKSVPIACIRTTNSEAVPPGAIDFFELINTNNINFSDLRSLETTVDDIAFLPYSSGTTGLPKGVMLTHKNITSNCEMIQTTAPYEPFVLETTETYQDVIPCILPFFHIYGLVIGMISKLTLGCKLTTLSKFNPEDFIKILYEYKGTIVNLVPPMVNFLTNNPKVTSEHGKYMRSVMSGAAPIGQLDAEKFVKKFPHVSFTQGYGLTETSPVILVSPFKSKNYAAAGFVTSSTEIKVVEFGDEKGIGMGPNQTGELWVRGPQVMKGYLNNEEANHDIFRDGNWMRTGDVTHYDENGYFYITDRIKELIKVKGFQVAPAELEEILRDHPKVLDAAVIGIPHAHNGEVPRAFVVLKPNHDATEKEIQDFIKDKVIHYKRLEGGVKFLDEIPKTASGKILRRELKQKYST